MSRAHIIAIINEDIAAIDFKLGLFTGTLSGNNTVIRMSPGMYAHRLGNVYTPVSITEGVSCYSPEDARIVVTYGAKGFEAVLFADALREERAALVQLKADVLAG